MFCRSAEQVDEQALVMLVIWIALTIPWCHCDAIKTVIVEVGVYKQITEVLERMRWIF